MLKRALSFTLCLVMLMSLCGCGEKEQSPSTKDDSAANVYLETAQMFVSKGDYASAIDTLEEGIKKTDSDKLTSYLQSVKEMQANSGGSYAPTSAPTSVPTSVPTSAPTSAPTSVPTNVPSSVPSTNPTQPSTPTVITDYNYYLTNWVSEGFSFESSGVVLSISLEYEWVQFDVIAIYDGYFMNRLIASTSAKEFRKPTHSLDAGNEECSTIATLNVEFSDECVILSISDLITQDIADPFKKFQDKAIVLTKDDDLFKEEIPDDPGEEPDNTPVYDLSKASGILAQAGLTEEEFRWYCTPISTGHIYKYSNSKTVGYIHPHHLEAGMMYYYDNPDDDTVQKATEKWNDIYLDYITGGEKYIVSTHHGMTWSEYHMYTKYPDLEIYLADQVYAPKGAEIIENNSEFLFNRMMEYPNEYIGDSFVLLDFNAITNRNGVYTDSDCVSKEVTIYDLRDDIHNPNVISGNEYYYYVIFQGTYNASYNEIGLKFGLISIEKIS